MRKRPIAIAIMLAALSAMPAAAADTGQITAEVTPAAPCVTVGGNLDFGTLAFSTTGTPSERIASTSFTNCSVEPEKIYLRGTQATSATSGATWLLTGAQPCGLGPDVYFVSVGAGTGGLSLSESDQLLLGAVSASTTTPLDAGLQMPCTGSSGMGERMTFSVIVTASF